jgi:hypothetical protein
MNSTSRRNFLKESFGLGAAALAAGPLAETLARAAAVPGSKMKLGLVTYLWGQYWDLPAVIANCAKTGILGVELRTEHKHGVEPNLSPQQRQEVKQRFADSPIPPRSRRPSSVPRPSCGSATIAAAVA